MGAAPGAPLRSLFLGGPLVTSLSEYAGPPSFSGFVPLPLLFVLLIMCQSGFWAQRGT